MKITVSNIQILFTLSLNLYLPAILECGPDMLEYEGFCMDKTQENMEMIQELISLNLETGLERTKKRSQRVTMLLARTNFDSMVDENGEKLRPKKFIEVKNM